MLAISEMSLHLYSTVLFLHIFCAIVWVGGGVTMQVLASRAMKAGPEEAAKFAASAEFMGTRVFLPASIILLILGLTMVLGWDFWSLTDVWVLVGLGGIASTIVIGAGFLGPEAGKLAKLIEEKGTTDPEVSARIARILKISRIDLAVLIVVVWDMAYKPFS